MGINGQELLLILVLVIVLFGAKKIPELASGLGKGIKEFKKAQQDAETSTRTEMIEKKEETKS